MFSYNFIGCFVAVIFDISYKYFTIFISATISFIEKKNSDVPSLAQCEIRNWNCLCLGKVCIRAKWPFRPALISGFCSMKRLGVFLLHPGRDASSSQGYPPVFNSPIPIHTLGCLCHELWMLSNVSVVFRVDIYLCFKLLYKSLLTRMTKIVPRLT